MVAVGNGIAVRAWYASAPGMNTQREWLQWAGAECTPTGPRDIVQLSVPTRGVRSASGVVGGSGPQ